MPRPNHRVDLLFVPADVERVPDAAAFDVVKQTWTSQGRLGRGAGRDALIIGGFRRLWLDRPDRLTLYANQQGGYYVRCPVTRGNLAPVFSAAVQEWRRGGEGVLACPHCQKPHPLESVILSPPGAFARGAVVFTDVGSLDMAEGARQALHAVLGEMREVIRRVG